MNMVLRRLHRLSLSSAFCSHSHTHTLPPPLTHSLTRSLTLLQYVSNSIPSRCLLAAA